MRSIQINRYGGPEVLEINKDAPFPIPKANQLLVVVHAASINPIDWKIREGYLKERVPLQFPARMGGDFSGIVKEVGSSVTEFKTGDPVYGSANILNGGSGSLAEQVVANEINSSRMPFQTNFEDAASLPLAGTSALQALEDHINLTAGLRILIHGGAGGIGSIAIQIAKALGAYVITTVSPDDMDYAKSLGADQVINYRSQKFEDVLKGVDAVFDTVGGETSDRSFPVIKQGGVLVSMAGQPNQEMAKQYGVTALGQGTLVDTPHLNRLTELVEHGKVKTQVDKVFPLEQIKEAFEMAEKGPRGKVVVQIKR